MRHKFCSNFLLRRLSTTPNPLPHESPPPQQLVQWLSSASEPSSSPQITKNFWISWKNNTLVVSTSEFQVAELVHPKSTLSKLLAPLRSRISLLRWPSSLSPVVVEYSSPNIAKPLHMGHLRSTITGNFVKNVAEFAGHKCKSLCFLGDWGKQFGVLHAGVMREVKDKDLLDTYIKGLSLHQLLDIYVKGSKETESNEEFSQQARQYSALLESGDPSCKSLWSHIRTVTLDHLKSCYTKLGIKFDHFEGEAEFHRDSPITIEALNILETLNLTTRYEDGSLRIHLGSSSSNDNNCDIKSQDQILLKSDNSSVYLLRDIACALNRLRQNQPGSKLVYVVDNSQSSHFQNLFKTMRLMGVVNNIDDDQLETPPPPFESTFTYVGFGRVSGMSTRSGNFLLLSDVIDSGTHLMHKARKTSKNARNTDDIELSEKLAISGLIVNALRVRRSKDYAFNWKEALSGKGNSGVALQYGAARLRSLLQKAGDNNSDDVLDINECLHVILCKKNEPLMDLVVCLANFEETFWRCYTTLEPCVLVTYALLLNDKMSKALASVNVLNNEDKQLRLACLWLYRVSANVLDNCMRILGVPVLDKGF